MPSQARAPTVDADTTRFEEDEVTASYQASPPYRSQRYDPAPGSGVLAKIVALLLGIAVAVLAIVAAVFPGRVSTCATTASGR
jgi:hypothetical protein